MEIDHYYIHRQFSIHIDVPVMHKYCTRTYYSYSTPILTLPYLELYNGWLNIILGGSCELCFCAKLYIYLYTYTHIPIEAQTQ